MTLKDTARGYLRDAKTAFDRAPAEVALAVMSAVLFSYAVENDFGMEAWVQLAVGMFIIFAAAWTGTLLHAMGALSLRARWILTVVGAVVAIAYLLLVPDISIESEAWRAFMMVIGVALLVFAAPAWAPSDAPASLRLRRINGRFILRTIGIGLYGAALFGGLALAIAAINDLFDLDLRGKIYAHVFGWIMLVLVPWVIVGGLDSYLEPLDRVSDVARVVHRLASFLVPPLNLLYYAILFVYAARIFTTGEMPKNLVSPMVLAAGLLTCIAAILFDPQPGETRTGPRVLRITPILFLPLVPLGFWALGTRINDYGWTEFRLLRVIVLALLLTLAVLATLQLVRRRPFSLRAIPAVLGVTVLLAALGPWSILAFAKRDQQGRLNDALRAANITTPVAIRQDTARRRVPREVYDRINNTAQYLVSHFGDDAVPIGGEGYLADRLGLVPATNDTTPQVLYGTMPNGVAVLTEAGTVYRIGKLNTTIPAGNTTIVVPVRPGGLITDIRPLLANIPPGRDRRSQGFLQPRALVVTDSAGQKRGELIILEAVIDQRRDSVRIMRLDGVLILR